MVDQKLLDYINSGIRAGRSFDQVKSELLSRGWGENDVNKALSVVQSGKRPSVKETSEKDPKKLIYIIGIVAVIVIIAVTSYYILWLGGQEPLDECGNGVCDSGENYVNCPTDCQRPLPPEGPQKVSVSPATQTVAKGNEFTVEVKISDADDLYGFQFNIEYDSNILQYEKIEEGVFLSNNGADTTYPITPKISAGLIKNIASTRLGPVGGLDGEGVLEKITFSALNTGTSEIRISNIKFVNSKAEKIDTSGENGQVTVS